MDIAINIMTLNFMRWVYFHHREKELMECNSVEELEKFFITHVYPFDEPSDNFKKGMKFIHFGEILNWIREERKKTGAVVESQQSIL